LLRDAESNFEIVRRRIYQVLSQQALRWLRGSSGGGQVNDNFHPLPLFLVNIDSKEFSLPRNLFRINGCGPPLQVLILNDLLTPD
jgi:hypothetical protein